MLKQGLKKMTGPVLFVIQMSDGCERRCHQDQLQRRTDVTVDKLFETDITPSSADTSDPHSPSDTEPTSGVSSRPEQVTAASERSISNQPVRKTYPTRN